MKKAISFTIADDKNIKYLPMLENSLRKFHSEKELPLTVVDQKILNQNPDDEKFYRATPYYSRMYLGEYDLVIKLDIDQIITSSFKHILENDGFDVAVCHNSNPREMAKWTVGVWDIHPLSYFNCGFVAMRSPEFVEHWYSLCNRGNFKNYQYREQDLLNIICHYGNYHVWDLDADDKFHGLASNSFWLDLIVRDKKLYLPVVSLGDKKYPEKEKEIVALHFAEGQGNLAKGNYRIKCSEEVIKHLDWLTSKNEKTENSIKL